MLEINQSETEEKQSEVIQKETMDVIVSDDEMEAKVKFYSPQVEYEKLSEKEIIQIIKTNGINSPLDIEMLQQIFASRVYDKEYIVAKGKQPIDGEDARIEYMVDVEGLSKPILHETENGQVDFKNIDVFKRVIEGDVLAKKTPASKGENGFNVRGKVIHCKAGRDKMLPKGEGTLINFKDNTLVTSRDGQLLYKGDKFVVSETLHIQGDVGPETGNIDFFNAVTITGNVIGGFSVTAGGDVVVGGTVEDALIESEGNVYIKGGFQGRKEGKIVCKGEVVSKFIQDATVISGKNIETESINYSYIKSEGSIIATKGKGNITGGECRATNKIEANTIGSRMGIKTVIEIEGAYQLRNRYNDLIEETSRYTQTIKSLEKRMVKAVMDKGEDISKLVAQKQALEEMAESTQTEFEELKDIVGKGVEGKVSCRDKIFEGTEVVINHHIKTFSADRVRCSVLVENGQIKVK